MSALYKTTPAPAQTFEVVPAVVTLLRADATLVAAIGGSSLIYSRRITNDKTGNNWKLILVREPVRPSVVEASHRYQNFIFDVMIEVHETVPNADQFLQKAHADVFALLVGQSISLTKGEVALPIERRSVPTSTEYDPMDHSYFSTAQYNLVIKPIGG